MENREYDKSCCLVVLRGEREGKSLFFYKYDQYKQSSH